MNYSPLQTFSAIWFLISFQIPFIFILYALFVDAWNGVFENYIGGILILFWFLIFFGMVFGNIVWQVLDIPFIEDLI